jgi:dTDP-4-dehydrorhamnose reductase
MAGHIITAELRATSGLELIDVGPRRQIFPETELCDISDEKAISELLDRTKPDVVVNCLGVLVAASEARKKEAVWVNAYLPHMLHEKSLASGFRLIHLSTDCVFSGASGPYREDAAKDGAAFYDASKALGEIKDGGSLTIRTSIIGPELRSNGTGLFDWVLRQKGIIRGYRKALWSGVTTLELARFIRYLLIEKRSLSGLIHYCVPGGISKFDLIAEILRNFDSPAELVPVDEPVLDKRLLCSRTDIGREPPAYREQIGDLKEWIRSHSNLYHYGTE